MFNDKTYLKTYSIAISDVHGLKIDLEEET